MVNKQTYNNWAAVFEYNTFSCVYPAVTTDASGNLTLAIVVRCWDFLLIDPEFTNVIC
jgi:hypothetical protein